MEHTVAWTHCTPQKLHNQLYNLSEVAKKCGPCRWNQNKTEQKYPVAKKEYEYTN